MSRAVERLHEFFAKRGVTIGAGGVAVAFTANAVQVAPVGLVATISTAAALAGNTLAATATATKAIAVTTLQRAIIGGTLVVAVGTGIYEARSGRSNMYSESKFTHWSRFDPFEGERASLLPTLAPSASFALNQRESIKLYELPLPRAFIRPLSSSASAMAAERSAEAARPS